jgi:hypothetical protein
MQGTADSDMMRRVKTHVTIGDALHVVVERTESHQRVRLVHSA